MERIIFINPPNKPMDALYKPANGPILYKDLLFLDVNKGGNLLVGSSNVTATFWDSSVQYYENLRSFNDCEPNGFMNSMNLLHDGKFAKNSILLAEGPCYLKVISLPDNINSNAVWKDCKEAMECLLQIDLWTDESKVLTCGKKYISIWDFKDDGLKKIHDYTNFHTDDVTSVSVKKSDSNLFASTSMDKRAFLWDSRMEIPAMEMYKNEFSPITSIAWNPSNTDTIAVGTDSGALYMLDINQPKDFVSTEQCFNDPIHKLAFSDNGNLAVCGDTSEINVYNCKKSEFDLVQKIEKHSKYVRGLAWHGDILFSSGYETQIFEHTF